MTPLLRKYFFSSKRFFFSHRTSIVLASERLFLLLTRLGAWRQIDCPARYYRLRIKTYCCPGLCYIEWSMALATIPPANAPLTFQALHLVLRNTITVSLRRQSSSGFSACLRWRSNYLVRSFCLVSKAHPREFSKN